MRDANPHVPGFLHAIDLWRAPRRDGTGSGYWARLDTPGRIQGLAARHLNLRPITSSQFDAFNNLPAPPPPDKDPIGDMLAGSAPVTGSIRAPAAPRGTR